MESLPPPSPFSPLHPIAGNIYLFEPPPPPPSSPSSKGPSLIIACTWMGGATPRRISKYTSAYHKLFPDAAILLITARPVDFALTPTAILHSRLSPAHGAIRRHLSHRADPEVLLHVFSNGGLFMAVNLLLSLRQAASISLGAHLRAVIMDCAPGRTEFWGTYLGGVAGLPPSTPARLVGKPALAIAAGVLVGGQRVGVLRGGIDGLRLSLHDEDLFGSAARLYLYSRGDPVVGWRDVEAHVRETRDRGDVRVEAVEFDGKAHCALALGDAERYWGAVGGFWRRCREYEDDLVGFLRGRL